jgi:uncharacterized protein (TIGR00730 family)
MPLSSVCVYCGSNLGRQAIYVEVARALGKALVARGLGLVYGGARVGVMGVIADSVLEAGGRVTGVIPQGLVDKEVAHLGLTELIVTSSMHERKTKMVERASAFIALPGGLGTLEELLEVWTWAQLGIHEKPCGVLNVAGYYDGLVAFMDHAVHEAYVKPEFRALLLVEREPDALLDRFASYVPPRLDKWITPAET